MLNIKKTLTIIFFCLLIFNIVTIISQARPYILKTNSSISLSSDNTDLGIVIPESGNATMNIMIKYEYNKFARPIGFPLPNRKTPTTISISVESKPSWCEINLDNYQFNAPIGSFLKKGTVNFNTTLTATIPQQSATAFSEEKIVLNATAQKNGNIVASSTLYELTISPGFIPNLEYSFLNRSITLKTGEEGNVSLFLKNKCNSKINVEISANTTEELIGIGLPSIESLDVGDEITIPISLKVYSIKSTNSKNVSVELFLNYYSIDDPSTKFATIDSPNSFYVLISDDSDVVDLTPFVIGIAIIFIVLYIIITIIIWRRR